jgi:methionyl-tRNA formyltransferase
MKIVFFGEDSFSLLALNSLVEAKHEILGVYCPKYSNNIHNKLEKYCSQNAITFERISNFNECDFVNKIKFIQPDLLVICHFQKIIKRELICASKFGSINLHPSLLPNYRGMAPQHWPLINGEKETGITVHFVDEGVDTGDIIIQKRINIENDWYVFDLQNHMRSIYSTIIKEAVDILMNGNNKYFIQKDLVGSYYGRLKIEDCHIGLDFSCNQAYNLIRAVSYPYYGARFGDLIIWKAEVMDSINHEFMAIFNSEMGYIDLGHGNRFIKFKDGVLKIIKCEKYEKSNN